MVKPTERIRNLFRSSSTNTTTTQGRTTPRSNSHHSLNPRRVAGRVAGVVGQRVRRVIQRAATTPNFGTPTTSAPDTPAVPTTSGTATVTTATVTPSTTTAIVQPVARPITQPLTQPLTQPTSQPASQPTTQPLTRPVPQQTTSIADQQTLRRTPANVWLQIAGHMDGGRPLQTLSPVASTSDSLNTLLVMEDTFRRIPTTAAQFLNMLHGSPNSAEPHRNVMAVPANQRAQALERISRHLERLSRADAVAVAPAFIRAVGTLQPSEQVQLLQDAMVSPHAANLQFFNTIMGDPAAPAAGSILALGLQDRLGVLTRAVRTYFGPARRADPAYDQHRDSLATAVHQLPAGTGQLLKQKVDSQQ